MQRFNYVAKDAAGNEQRGVVEAQNMAEAQLVLRQNNLTAKSLVAEGGKKKKKGALDIQLKMPKFLQSKRVKPKDLTVLTRQLATLVESGLPLLRGLRILTKQSAVPGLKSVLQGMSEAVEGGATFSDALAQHPKVFDNLYVNMTRAGEAAGSLEISLARLAEFLEKAQKIKSKVKAAMTYPIVVLCVALGLTGFMMVAVIPKFEKLFKDMLGNDAKMPAVTQFVINLAHNFMDYSIPIAIAVAVVVVACRLVNKTSVVLLVFACRMVNKTKWGNMFFDRIKLKLPGFGELIRKSSIGRTTRTLGTLMQSGVPVLQALDIVRDTSGNAVIAKAYQQIHDAVKEGDNMTPSMEASGQFPPMVVSMVDVGEETGALPDMLNRIANTYDNEVDDAVNAMTSIIEPMMIVFLAVIVGTIVIAMFSPLTQIISGMSGG